MYARSHFSRRPCLEVLEGRAVPAVVTPSFTRVTELSAEVLLLQTSIVSIAPTTAPAGAVTPGVDEVVSGPAATLAVGDLSALFAPATGGALSPVLPTLSFRTDVGALGFTGRIVYPGTELQARVANGDGPLTQPPGQFLRGWSAPPSADAEPPRAAERAAGAQEAGAVAPHAVAPGEEGAWPDWAQQDAILRAVFSPGDQRP
jgi:hypothetical protein